jgi:hypothetical protein
MTKQASQMSRQRPSQPPAQIKAMLVVPKRTRTAAVLSSAVGGELKTKERLFPATTLAWALVTWLDCTSLWLVVLLRPEAVGTRLPLVVAVRVLVMHLLDRTWRLVVLRGMIDVGLVKGVMKRDSFLLVVDRLFVVVVEALKIDGMELVPTTEKTVYSNRRACSPHPFML